VANEIVWIHRMLPRREKSSYPTNRNWLRSIPFLGANFIPLLAILTGVSRSALVLGAALYVSRMFFITAGYHRYFSHRSYQLRRFPQFIMALGGLTAVQQGPLWWASHHRDHHRYTDTERDPHSPQQGFWRSHIGWIISGRFDQTDYETIADFSRFPELRWLNTHDWVGPVGLGIASYLIAGWSGVVVGFFGSTVLLWHATFSVNSFAHLLGRRRYATTDSSRNNWIIALLTLGEGWHNNHHHYPRSARQGFRWWELDISFQVLRLLSAIRVVRGLRQPPAAVRSGSRIADGNPDLGLVRYHLSRAASLVDSVPTSEELLELLESTATKASAIVRSNRTTQRFTPRADIPN
jgi:stearoyl-CoA desaturase (Delta-9 desaturase)